MITPWINESEREFFEHPFRSMALADPEFMGWGRNNSIMKPLKPVMDLDFVETDSDFMLHADLPGVNKNDVDIKVENGICTISAEKRNRHESKTTTTHRLERSYGRVQRSMRLPQNADQSHPSAKFENGVLELKFPKTAQSQATHVSIA